MTDYTFMEWADKRRESGFSGGHAPNRQINPVAVPPIACAENMDTSAVPVTQFLDLKSLKNVYENDVVTLSKAQEPTQNHRPPSATVLPAPTFGGFNFGCFSRDTTDKEKISKTFDGDLTPLPDVDSLRINLREDITSTHTVPSQPADKFTEGEVKNTTKDALYDLLKNLNKLHVGDTGCIISETCDPECNQYIQDYHFVTQRCVGRGSFGEVDLCFDSKTEKPFVRKVLWKNQLRASEVITSLTLDHVNITKVFGLVLRGDAESFDHQRVELYLEYGGTSLMKFLQDGESLNPSQIRSLTCQGLRALHHMDRYNMIHHDIKPENILIMKNGKELLLKVTDFGSSRLPIDPLVFVGITPEYLAPEICQLFLQKHYQGRDWGLTESDITGKVDVFAFALVVMFMYKGYHILVKVINNGHATYKDMNARRMRELHLNLIIQMAKETEDNFFVQNLIPDECSLDMRDILTNMTYHKHQDRMSAAQALGEIEALEKKLTATMVPQRKTAQGTPKCRILQSSALCHPELNFSGIPDVAEYCMESETGPVKNKTMNKLRRKLQPYGKDNCGGKTGGQISRQQEVQTSRCGIASKQLQMPATPVALFEGLSLEQALQKEQTVQMISGTTERNAPLAQPSDVAAAPIIDITCKKQASNRGVQMENLGWNNASACDRSLGTDRGVTAGAGQRFVHLDIESFIKMIQQSNTLGNRVNDAFSRVVQPVVISEDDFVPINHRAPQHEHDQPVDVPMEEETTPVGNLPNLPDFM